MSQKPSVGRIVHYHCLFIRSPQPVAALITHVHSDGIVELTLFRKGSAAEPLLHSVEFREKPTAGCWSWPERV